jgi:hypothetical protein
VKRNSVVGWKIRQRPAVRPGATVTYFEACWQHIIVLLAGWPVMLQTMPMAMGHVQIQDLLDGQHGGVPSTAESGGGDRQDGGNRRLEPHEVSLALSALLETSG